MGVSDVKTFSHTVKLLWTRHAQAFPSSFEDRINTKYGNNRGPAENVPLYPRGPKI